MTKKAAPKKAPSKANTKKTPAKTAKTKDVAAKAKEARSPGVIATMVELLKAASAKSPLAKADLIAKLQAKFPDRPSVGKTVSCQLSKRIETEQGVKLHKNESGYWAT